MKYLNILILLLIISGCKAWDISMIPLSDSNNSNKLLTLEKHYGDFSNATPDVSSDEIRLFEKEVETNLIDPFGDKYGYISLSSRVVNYKSGFPMGLPHYLLLGTPLLVGIPYGMWKYVLEVDIAVYDKNQRLLGKYSSIGESGMAPVALYYGYRESDAQRKAYAEALVNAMDSIRPKIVEDISRINQLLMKTGKLEITPHNKG